MSNSLTAFIFDNTKEIRIVDQNGDCWFILRDLLDAMRTTTPVTVAIESIEQGLGKGFNDVIPLQTQGGMQKTAIIAEAAATYLVARSNTQKGRDLNRFIHVEVLPQIRKTGQYKPKQQAQPIIPIVQQSSLISNGLQEMQITFLCAEKLRYSESAMLTVVGKVLDKYGMDKKAILPPYAIDVPRINGVDQGISSLPTASATTLLKRLGINASAQQFNKTCERFGFLEQKSRPSTTPGQKEKFFWSITDAGLKYGKNVTSPQSPRETQPHWYESTFMDLFADMMAKQRNLSSAIKMANAVLI